MSYMEFLSLLSRTFGYTHNIKILDCMLNFPASEFTKRELRQALDMNSETFNKYFELLEEEKIVEVCRTVRKTKLYRVNRDSPLVKAIMDF
ncbi:hypothetical protein [Nitrososphaera viennensis]|mgnify:CR=1 FL=1|uniref:ArnR1-like winged helix-turn-helix domain-containing protein n=2 Tax=Nitrososphaera viennensis TaxID=1034015 RepID=A0A060HTM6_9ARCH|nr:hypothetical protein [Nitrososphaera viennensis]AIC16806.1 hypothetical protein NVIE_025360 [Nitrososphaera viennensis EN76]UVS68711.1 hypothetical protein NWT39_12495 [Nitrososphaera viennensis]